MSLWTEDFGDEYTQRNQPSADGRAEIWQMLIPYQVTSILEVGANKGANLESIAQFSTSQLRACEPNKQARDYLRKLDICDVITADYADALSFETGSMDLVFTCGVLIHIAPDKLLLSMREIHRVTKRWIICAEYFAPKEEMIPYRGKDDQLWRRDYGSLWLDNFHDLHYVSSLFAWNRITGFDNLTFWLFEKGEARH